MSFFYYLLEVNVYILIFYGFYYAMLRRETFYSLNRYYLIGSTLSSFLLPLLQIGALHGFYGTGGEEATIVQSTMMDPRMFTAVPFKQSAQSQISEILTKTYIIVAIAFLVHLVVSLIRMAQLIIRAPRIKKDKIVFIPLQKTDEKAFSFFNFLFIHSDLEEKQTVIDHELVHIHQKHSFDVILFEIVQVICWFNPVVYLLKNDIRLLHEYLADEKATETSLGKHAYALFLIRNSFGLPTHQITSQIFNQSILKRRINMLNKTKTAARARLRLLLLLPLAGVMLCMGTMAFKKDYSVVDLYPEKYSEAQVMQQQSKKKDPTSKTDFFAPYRVDPKTKSKIPAEDRLIVINGKIMDNSKVGAIFNIDNIDVLRPADAIKKYGSKASYGAIIVTGKNITVATTVTAPPVVVKNKQVILPPVVKKDQVKFPPPIVKRDQVKFPPPVVYADKGPFLARWKYDSKLKKWMSVEKRLIVINGEQLRDLSNFGGVTDATTIQFIGPAENQKYGTAGKFGVVEINGNNVKILEGRPMLPPPPPVERVVKFPPPTVTPDPGTFYAKWRYDNETEKMVSRENRLIIINGKPLTDLSDFGGVTDATTINIGGPTSAKVYGTTAKYGVVVITGDNVKILKKANVPPPPPMMPRDQIKFPPPIVRPDKPVKKGSKTTTGKKTEKLMLRDPNPSKGR